MGIEVTEKCRIQVLFTGVYVSDKLWLKWKGRKAIEGWKALRFGSNYNGGIHSGVKFLCYRRDCAANMTPEKIEEITTMIYLLKE